MRIPLSWLNEYVDVSDIAPDELAEKLTRSGLQVESIETVGAESARYDDTGTGSQSDEKRDQQIDDRSGGSSHRAERLLADEIADNHGIHGVVQLLKDGSRHDRQKEHQKLFPDHAMQKIASFFVHLSSPYMKETISLSD